MKPARSFVRISSGSWPRKSSMRSSFLPDRDRRDLLPMRTGPGQSRAVRAGGAPAARAAEPEPEPRLEPERQLQLEPDLELRLELRPRPESEVEEPQAPPLI